MQKALVVTLLSALITLLASCHSFRSPRDTLATLQDAAIAARMTIRPVIDGYCAQAKRACETRSKLQTALFVEGEADCPEWEVCQRVRMIIISTLEAVQFAIADANLALALGDEERFDKAVERVGELLVEVQRQMQILQIIPSDAPESAQEAS